MELADAVLIEDDDAIVTAQGLARLDYDIKGEAAWEWCIHQTRVNNNVSATRRNIGPHTSQHKTIFEAIAVRTVTLETILVNINAHDLRPVRARLPENTDGRGPKKEQGCAQAKENDEKENDERSIK